LGLNDDPRWNYSWKALGLGVRWRATVAMGILSEKQYYSIPIIKEFYSYCDIAEKNGIWDRLDELGYSLLLDESEFYKSSILQRIF
jgi:hypothetical protein